MQILDKDKNDPTVVNLSSVTLNNKEISLLHKGLKFTPTPQSDTCTLKSELSQFCRKLRLQHHFHKDDPNLDESRLSEPEYLVRNKSTFTPRAGQDVFLDGFITTISTDQVQNKPFKSNLNKEQRGPLNALKNTSDLIIKRADKGGAIVVMDTSFYQENMSKMLSDKEYYAESSLKANDMILRKNQNFMGAHTNILHTEEVEYLCKFQPSSILFWTPQNPQKQGYPRSC
ncbi:hypothetical protein SNE40_022325 [Patella caerulea]|uniref:Uncharacterized protein n=1 Tax=Patella caerulea TaxID=87958 RepID=A0AAN8GFJ4_PATCE